jgi:hypothetical protein
MNENKPNKPRRRRKRRTHKVLPMVTKIQDLLPESTIKAVRRIGTKKRTNRT